MGEDAIEFSRTLRGRLLGLVWLRCLFPINRRPLVKQIAEERELRVVTDTLNHLWPPLLACCSATHYDTKGGHETTRR